MVFFLLVPATMYGGAAVCGDVLLAGVLAAFIASAMESSPHHTPGLREADTRRLRRAEENLQECLRAADQAQERLSRERASGDDKKVALAERASQEAQEALERARAKLRSVEVANGMKEEDGKHYPCPEFLKKAINSKELNIAVTGNSGVGKSSFINFIRKIKKKDKYFAPTGSQECTMEPTVYTSTSGDKLWDLPGAGTVNFPQDTYVRDMGIRYFDIVFLVTAERFTEIELKIKQEMDTFKVPCFCVRNKIDLAVDSQIDEDDEDEPLGEESNIRIKDKVIADTKSYFKRAYRIDPIYVVSSRDKDRDKFEYEKLTVDAEREVNNARIRRDCPVCLDVYADFGGEAGSMTKLGCGHMLCATCHSHEACSSSCPLCRMAREEQEAQEAYGQF